MAHSLQGLRSSRGAVAPEPFLLEDVEQGISTMSEGLSAGYDSLAKSSQAKLFKILAS